MSKDEHRVKLPKLERSGANWVTYCDRLIWALQSESIDDHIASSSLPQAYKDLGKISNLEPEACWKEEEHTIKQILSSTLLDTTFLKIKGSADVMST